jgi:restriction system protein
MGQRTLAFRTYHFRPPAWRSPAALQLQTVVLSAGTVVWLALYGWLAVRLWQVGPMGAGWIEAGAALLAVGIGVAVVLGWWRALRRWRAQLGRGAWPALSLEQVMRLSPSEFEEYVSRRIFERQGYSVLNTRDVKDNGIDILVTDAHVVQCKRYRGTVGEPIVRDLYGTMIHNHAAMAYLITTGSISDAARRWAMGKPIGLIDGTQLVELARAEPAQG